MHSHTNIPVSPSMRDELRELKRGGETWDSLFEKMAAQYDPDQSTEVEA